MDNDQFIIDLLLQQGIISEAQVEAAKQAQKESGEEETSLLDALYESKACTEQDVIDMLAAEYGMDTYDFDKAGKMIPTEVVDVIPGNIAKRYQVMPVSLTNGVLRVAMADPGDFEALDAIRYLLKMDVEGVVASKRQIKKQIDLNYSDQSGENLDTLLTDMTETTIDVTQGNTMDTTADVQGAEKEDDEAPIIRLVSLLILEAFRTRASDIHMEPMEKIGRAHV